MPQIGEYTSVHSDVRRTIREFNGDDFAVTDFEIYARIPLGNHYHDRKSEVFSIRSGGGFVLMKNIDTDEPVAIHSLFAGSVVKIEPRIAHTFVLDPNSTMHCYSSARFDPNDQDMLPYALQLPVSHASATIIVYKRSDPSQIYLDIKDDGLPVKSFRRTLCPVGGNWIGDAAKNDVGPHETAAREFEEELSFERSTRDSIELEQLGLAEREISAPTHSSGLVPTDEDERTLRSLKQAVINAMEPFGDYVITVGAYAFQIKDPESTRGALRYLTSYFMAGLNDAEWEQLTSLQRRYGNLSNESISMIVSLDDIVERRIRCAWGHEFGLHDFFHSQGLARADQVPVLPGINAVRIGQPSASYDEYRKVFDIAKVPT